MHQPQPHQSAPIHHPPHAQHTPPPDDLDEPCPPVDLGGKGKAATMPVPIRSSTVLHDLFDLEPSSSSSTSSYPTASPASPDSNPISPEFPYSSFDTTTIDPALVQNLYDNTDMRFSLSPQSSKGKEKDVPPILPPLSFSEMGLNYDQASWPSFGSVASPGPSSYGSISSPTRDMTPSASPEDTAAVRTSTSATSMGGVYIGPSAKRIPSRRRSLSALSVPSSPSFASLTMSKIKVKLGPSTTTQSNLARKLLSRKRGDATPDPGVSSETVSLTAATSTSSVVTPSSPLDPSVAPWYAAPLQYDLNMVGPLSFVSPDQGTEKRLSPRPSVLLLKTKGRSKSSPLPFSALDFVPAASTDVFKPLPLVLHRNYIDQILPKELQIHILKFFVLLFEEDHVKGVARGRWTISKAISSRHQFVGRDKGIRELLKLARISHSWESLVYDGQLWTDLDLHSFPGIPKSALLRLTRLGGSFIRRIDFAGHCRLQAATLTDIANHLCLRNPLSYTHLTAINLQGCSALTTRSLHHLLVRCRSLRDLCLKGLMAATNTTCELLATFCTQLERLNLNRCPNMDAEGIRCLGQTMLAQAETLRLKELRVSGLKYMDDVTMRVLGKAAPDLEVLDLSYVRQLHNSALRAFVTVDDGFDYTQSGVEIIRLNARQVGQDSSNDSTPYYRRRMTKLRHLSLSFCILLTDTACLNIAHAVPRLEFLEMAGIGADLKDDGLIQLLETTPHIRRIDLEDATDITDSVLSCITPIAESPAPLSHSATEPVRKRDERPPQPGHALEWLTVSHAANISDEAFLTLVRGCPKLRVLEADNTRLSGSTLKEFVDISRKRKTSNARMVAIDCRNVVEGIVKNLAVSGATRPRLAVKAFWARRLGYVDGNDEMCEDDLKVGQDECDPKKVVVKTFYSWQTVDAVRGAREKRKKAVSRRAGGSSSDFSSDAFDDDLENGGRTTGGLTRWWSPSGRNSPPIIPDLSNDGCVIM
ncbi:hypothetical protein P691DRAFT_663285 [Macrolepiota fuliginosa MF-IS2]|uniref:RNI-like protein n=1 Tax=Macrolepiota fuliginosa MF-IS2 TaxID=1400762 RepID=A0A9P5XKU9_9AGAR|nr:hypothetical protein P691DRAFT_663285 [Macrolepiota fuliginosa MF-IS2]